MTTAETRLIWFRKDLRLADNPIIPSALESAAKDTRFVFLYIVAKREKNPWPLGSAFKAWLEPSLKSLDQDLQKCGGSLVILEGDPLEAVPDICKQFGASKVYWGRQYEAFTIQRDTELKKTLSSFGVEVTSVNSALLQEPWEGVKSDKTPFLVYTPFWRNFVKRRSFLHSQGKLLNHLCSHSAVVKKLSAFRILSSKDLLHEGNRSGIFSVKSLSSLGLRSSLGWDSDFFSSTSQPGESAAIKRLGFFLDEVASGYKETRDLPAVDGTSRLSAYLAHGELSPVRVWHELEKRFGTPDVEKKDSGTIQYFKELVWREFSYHLLYHFPETPDQPLKKQYADFPWEADYARNLEAWQRGNTGYPIIDAGMRQLWQTGWMHNRVRMIVASFLIKHLLIPWNEGARWFWDTLVDADLASNTQGWQWTAGCGADASPFFRVFNPIVQGEKFDPEGAYVKKFVPELKNVPADWVHKPFECPLELLKSCGVVLGVTYPKPLIEHGEGRQRALMAYSRLTAKDKKGT